MVSIRLVGHDIAYHRLDWRSCYVPVPTDRNSASNGRTTPCNRWDSLLCPVANRRVAREKDEAATCCLNRARRFNRYFNDTRLHLWSDVVGADHTVRQFDTDARDTVPAPID